ncbi:MAG: cytochrome C [Verrucomicrobia bacterium]|nr:MAG: cytochrome C [Verrucomicrobiota bacterium]
MNSKTGLVLICLAAAAFAFAACERSAKSGHGLILPEGDIGQGKAAFVKLGCIQCHTVKSVGLPAFEGETTFMLELGGEVLKVKTYGDLVTSIINPDHVISPQYLSQLPTGSLAESPMTDLTREMTVSEMVDLVTFLHSRYIKKPRPDYRSFDLYP